MISKILKACQFLLVRKMILLFAYQEISAIFTGPILFFCQLWPKYQRLSHRLLYTASSTPDHVCGKSFKNCITGILDVFSSCELMWINYLSQFVFLRSQREWQLLVKGWEADFWSYNEKQTVHKTELCDCMYAHFYNCSQKWFQHVNLPVVNKEMWTS